MTATTTTAPDTGSVPVIIDVTRRIHMPAPPQGRRRAPGQASQSTTSDRTPKHRAGER